MNPDLGGPFQQTPRGSRNNRDAAVHFRHRVCSRNRLQKLLIINEKDCIKIKQKGWLDKKEWREIHDILSAGLQLAGEWQGKLLDKAYIFITSSH
jgi:hypothetical protein